MYRPNNLKAFFHYVRRNTAKYWFGKVKPYTIGITGSMGKTYTTYILSSLLPDAVSTDINLDTIYNIPITVLKLKRSTKIAIIEYGIDQKNEMNKHLEIAQPNISIITGITPVHTDKDHLGSLDNLIIEKRKLIEVLGLDDFAVLNYDDQFVRAMAGSTRAEIVFFGSDPKACTVSFDPQFTKINSNGTSFKIRDNNDKIEIVLDTKLFGSQFVYNLMAAYIVFKKVKSKQGLHSREIAKQFSNVVEAIKPLEGRMSLENLNGVNILNDSLRSNPISVKNGLSTVDMISLKKGQRKIIVLGEMGELGESEVIEHENIGEEISKLKSVDIFLGIGPLLKHTIDKAIKDGFPKEKIIYANNTIEAGIILKEYLNSGDFIYIKGSKLKHLERIMLIVNGENINCNVVSCPFYNNCKVCKYRSKGYKRKH